MPWVHLCRSSDCWCQGRLYGEIVAQAGLGGVPQPEWHSEAMKEIHMGLKKPLPPSEIKPPANDWVDPVDMRDIPNIYMHMHDRRYDNGQPRVSGAISLFTLNGCLKACINDRDNNRTTFVEAASFGELLAAIEKAICDDNTEWKYSAKQEKTPPY